MPKPFVPFSGVGNRLGGNEDGYRNRTPNENAARAAESRALLWLEEEAGAGRNVKDTLGLL